MTDTKSQLASGSKLLHWRIAQYLLLVASVVLVALLFLKPTIGLNIFWNVVIPTAPALIVIAPGVWRNICPMATLNLMPQRMGISKQGSLSRHMKARLGFLSLIALFIIVPYRHLSLDTNGERSALMLIAAGLIAFAMGIAFKWRSGWCTTLCPIHPVERLYGISPAKTFKNSRCSHCVRCTSPCPDSTKSMTPAITGPSPLATMSGHLLIGSFAGFIWGWNQLPDFSGTITVTHYLHVYLWPLDSALISLAVYMFLYQWVVLTKEGRRTLIKVFATIAVSTYYWFRIPALAGFGPHPGSGMLYDLTRVLPSWIEHLSHIITTAFFTWFILLRKNKKISWLIRPPVVTTRKKRVRHC
ncbi:MAG: ferredoxin [Candidatus Thiodiazotropha sp.]|jgi:hypothetical protein